MKLRVDHEQLNDVVNKTYAEYENFFGEIHDMETEIANLKNVWQGEEANVFYVKVDNFLNNLKSIPETYNTLAKFMDKANYTYRSVDEECSKEINKVRAS